MWRRLRSPKRNRVIVDFQFRIADWRYAVVELIEFPNVKENVFEIGNWQSALGNDLSYGKKNYRLHKASGARGQSQPGAANRPGAGPAWRQHHGILQGL